MAGISLSDLVDRRREMNPVGHCAGLPIDEKLGLNHGVRKLLGRLVVL